MPQKSKISAILFVAVFAVLNFVAIFLAKNSMAQNAYSNASDQIDSTNVSTNDIIREVEKTLLFSDDEKSKMEVVKDQLNQKSDFKIITRNKDDSKEDAIDIKVNDTKQQVNIDARTKEKLAYNATLNGQYEAAIELYKQVIDAEPNNNYALFSLAILYQKIGQFRQAKVVYYKLLQNNPDNKDEVIGNILATLSEESPRDALYLLMRLANTHPQSDYILVQTALAYDNVKNYSKAIEFLQRAIALNPNRLDYEYNLAIIYDKIGDYEKALNAYSDVVVNYQNSQWNAAIPLQATKLRIETLKEKI
jgi:tetratricopeptide (TPR) repeat protein